MFPRSLFSSLFKHNRHFSIFSDIASKGFIPNSTFPQLLQAIDSELTKKSSKDLHEGFTHLINQVPHLSPEEKEIIPKYVINYSNNIEKPELYESVLKMLQISADITNESNSPNQETLSAIVVSQAKFLAFQSKLKESEEVLESNLKFAYIIQDQLVKATFFGLLGNAKYGLGKLNEAADYMEQAYRIVARIPILSQMFAKRVILADIYLRLKNQEKFLLNLEFCCEYIINEPFAYSYDTVRLLKMWFMHLTHLEDKGKVIGLIEGYFKAISRFETSTQLVFINEHIMSVRILALHKQTNLVYLEKFHELMIEKYSEHKFWIGESYYGVAVNYLQYDEFKKTIVCAEECLKCWKDFKNKAKTGLVLNLISRYYLRIGDLDLAKEYLEQAQNEIKDTPPTKSPQSAQTHEAVNYTKQLIDKVLGN